MLANPRPSAFYGKATGRGPAGCPVRRCGSLHGNGTFEPLQHLVRDRCRADPCPSAAKWCRPAPMLPLLGSTGLFKSWATAAEEVLKGMTDLVLCHPRWGQFKGFERGRSFEHATRPAPSFLPQVLQRFASRVTSPFRERWRGSLRFPYSKDLAQ